MQLFQYALVIDTVRQRIASKSGAYNGRIPDFVSKFLTSMLPAKNRFTLSHYAHCQDHLTSNSL